MSSTEVVVQSVGHHPMLYAYAMGPYNSGASFAAGRLEGTSSQPQPYMVRDEATGVWQDRLPLAPERVWRLMHDIPGEEE